MLRAVAFGFALSFGFAGAAAGAFLLARAILQPDRWPNPGLGWLAVVAMSVAAIAGAIALLRHVLADVERGRYLRANRRR